MASSSRGHITGEHPETLIRDAALEQARRLGVPLTSRTPERQMRELFRSYYPNLSYDTLRTDVALRGAGADQLFPLMNQPAAGQRVEQIRDTYAHQHRISKQQQEDLRAAMILNQLQEGTRSDLVQERVAVGRGGYNALLANLRTQLGTDFNGNYSPSTRVSEMHAGTFRQTFNRGDGYGGPQDNNVLTFSQAANALSTIINEAEDRGYRADVLHVRLQLADRPNAKNWAAIAIPAGATIEELTDLFEEAVRIWQEEVTDRLLDLFALPGGKARERLERYKVFEDQPVDIDLTQFAITFSPIQAAPSIVPPGMLEGLGPTEIKYLQGIHWELRSTIYGNHIYKTIACPEGYNCLFYAIALAKGIQYHNIYSQYKGMLPITHDKLISLCSANRVGFNLYVFGEDADGVECVRLQKAALGTYDKIYDVIIKPDPRTGINHVELLIDTNGITLTEEIQEDARRYMPNCIRILRAKESEYSAPIYICFDTETVWLVENGCIVPYGAQLFMRNPDDFQNLKSYEFMCEGPDGTKVPRKVWAHKRVLFTAPDPVKDNHLEYDEQSNFMRCNGSNIIKEAFAEIRKFAFECEQWRMKSLKYLRKHICPCRMMPYQPLVLTWNGSRFDNQIFIQYALSDLEPTASLYTVTTFVAARDILRLKVDNITFIDVCKLFPGKLAQVAADFGLPVQKGDMDHLNVQKMYESDYLKVDGVSNRMESFLRSELYRSYAFRDVVLVYQIFIKLDGLLRPLQSLKTKHVDIHVLPRTKTSAIQSELDDIANKRRELAKQSKHIKLQREDLKRTAEIDMALRSDILAQENYLKQCRAQLRAEKEKVDSQDQETSYESKVVKMLRRMTCTKRNCPQCAVASIERHGSYLKIQIRKRLFEYMTAGQFSFNEMLAHMPKHKVHRLPIFVTAHAEEYKQFIEHKTSLELQTIEATVLEALLRKMQIAGRSDIWHVMNYDEDRCRSLDERSQYVRPCLEEYFPLGDADYIDLRSEIATEQHMKVGDDIQPLVYTYGDTSKADRRYWRIADKDLMETINIGIFHVIVLEQPDFVVFPVRVAGGLEWTKPDVPGVQVVSSIGITEALKAGCKILIGDGLTFKDTARCCKPFMEKYYQLKVEEDMKKMHGEPFNSSKRALGKAIILIPTGKMAQRDHKSSMELILGRDRADKKTAQLRERYGLTNVKDPEEFGHDMYVVSYMRDGLKGSGKPHLYTNLIYEWARMGIVTKILMHVPYSELLCMETDGVIMTETGYRAALAHEEFRNVLKDTPDLRPGVMTDDTTKDIIDCKLAWYVKGKTFWNNLTKTWWRGEDTKSDTYTPGGIWCIDTYTYWVNGLDTNWRAPCWIGCGKKCYATYALNIKTGEKEAIKMRFKGVTANCDKCKGDDCKHRTQVLKEEYVGKIMEKYEGKTLDSDLINSLTYHEQTDLFRDDSIMEAFKLEHFFQFLHRHSLTIITSHIKRASPFAQEHQQWLRNYYTSKTLVIEPKKNVRHDVSAMTDMNRLWLGFKCIEQQAQRKQALKAEKEEAERRMIVDALLKPPPEEWL